MFCIPDKCCFIDATVALAQGKQEDLWYAQSTLRLKNPQLILTQIRFLALGLFLVFVVISAYVEL